MVCPWGRYSCRSKMKEVGCVAGIRLREGVEIVEGSEGDNSGIITKVINDQTVRLYVIHGVPETTKFQTNTR